MTGQLIHVADNFWNIRGSYRIGGVIDVGTQASLVRLANGKFVLLDCYTVRGAAADFREWANELIDRWQDAENLCAAHTAALLAQDNKGESIHTRLLKALDKISGILKSHERKYQ